jgi:hypothetical protein
MEQGGGCACDNKRCSTDVIVSEMNMNHWKLLSENVTRLNIEHSILV